MQCPQCGHEEQGQYRFCTQCGATLHEEHEEHAAHEIHEEIDDHVDRATHVEMEEPCPVQQELKEERPAIKRPTSPLIGFAFGTWLGPWLSAIIAFVLLRRWTIRKHYWVPISLLLLNGLFLSLMFWTNHGGLWLVTEENLLWQVFHLLFNPLTLLFNLFASLILLRLLQPYYRKREAEWQLQHADQQFVLDMDRPILIKEKLLQRPVMWALFILFLNSLIVEIAYQFAWLPSWLDQVYHLPDYAVGGLLLLIMLWSIRPRLQQRMFIDCDKMDELRESGIVPEDEPLLMIHLADREMKRGILCTPSGFRYWNLTKDPPYRQIAWEAIRVFEIASKPFSSKVQLHLQLKDDQQIIWNVRGFRPFYTAHFIANCMAWYYQTPHHDVASSGASSLETGEGELGLEAASTQEALVYESKTTQPVRPRLLAATLMLLAFLLIVVGGEAALYWTLSTNGQQAFDAGKYEDAAQYYRWASRIDPFHEMEELAKKSDYEYWMKQGDDALRQRKYDDAIKLFDKAQEFLNTAESRSNRKEAEYRKFIALGEKASLKEDYGAAIKFLRKAQGIRNTEEVQKKMVQVEYMYHYMKAQQLLYYDPVAALAELQLAAEVIESSEVNELMDQATEYIINDFLYVAENFLYMGDVEGAMDVLKDAAKFAPEDERIQVLIDAITEGKSAQESMDQNPLVILPDWEWYADDEGYVYAVGTIVNRSDKLIEQIVIYIEYYDANGDVVLTDWAYADGPVQGGEKTTFTIYSNYQEEMEEARVEIQDYTWATEVQSFPN